MLEFNENFCNSKVLAIHYAKEVGGERLISFMSGQIDLSIASEACEVIEGFWRMVGLGSLAMVFVNAVVSGQRIALALVPACLVLLLLLSGQLANLKRFIPIFGGLVLILTIAIASNPVVVQERVDSFIDRWNASPPYEFITQQFEEVSHNTKNPFGNGLGKATNSARIMGPTKLVETYYPKVMFEVGILGVLGFLGLVTTLTICAFKTYRKAKNRNFRGYGAVPW